MAAGGGGYKFQVTPSTVSQLGSTLRAEGQGLAGQRTVPKSGTGSPSVDAALGGLGDQLGSQIGVLSLAVEVFGQAVKAASESYVRADTPGERG